MRLNYTLPGLLPEEPPPPAEETGERPVVPFGAHLQRLSAPEFKDWRTLLRLNAAPAGLAGVGPPKAPHGIESRDGASQRAWWRRMLEKHAGPLESDCNNDANIDLSVQRMLGWLSESQRREDEIFARYFAEAAD
jgi:hypothetical protein